MHRGGCTTQKEKWWVFVKLVLLEGFTLVVVGGAAKQDETMEFFLQRTNEKIQMLDK